MAVSTQSTPSMPSQPSPTLKRVPLSVRQRFNLELSQALFDFVIQLLPTVEELAVKEDVRKLLERLIRTIEPDSRLLSFGSTANGFSLRNSDMDLCCLIDSDERLSATDLVTMLGDLLERETKFHVKPLPHARIPIVKLSLDPSPGLPYGIACDIGFENRLALENTRLLYCYAMIDPTRVRTMVLFLKVWCKRRKINSPYKGTLSSYGYVLLVIYFLVHVKNPPVLPNLQQLPPLRPITHEETHIGGHNVWFFDDIELLRQRWQSANRETVGQLLTDFFKYYAREFLYNTGVASIREGLLKKETKGWQNDLDPARYKDSRERNRFCIEDPFETDFNVARCVTKDGLYTIRGEFMRASRILSCRHERAIFAIAQLCEERADTLGPTASTGSPASIPSRLSPFPPQAPYTVGSSPLRRTEIRMPTPSRPSQSSSTQGEKVLSATAEGKPSALAAVPPKTPEHMAPQRLKWTSPPPATAPKADHLHFEDRLGLGLTLATAPGNARQEGAGSSGDSEILTDDGDADEVRSMVSDSVQSMVSEDIGRSRVSRRSPTTESLPSFSPAMSQSPHVFPPVQFRPQVKIEIRHPSEARGRQDIRTGTAESAATDPHAVALAHRLHRFAKSPRLDSPRRSISGPPGPSKSSSPVPQAHAVPLPASPTVPPLPPGPQVVYETQINRASPASRHSPATINTMYSHSSTPSSSTLSSPHLQQQLSQPHTFVPSHLHQHTLSAQQQPPYHYSHHHHHSSSQFSPVHQQHPTIPVVYSPSMGYYSPSAAPFVPSTAAVPARHVQGEVPPILHPSLRRRPKPPELAAETESLSLSSPEAPSTGRTPTIAQHRQNEQEIITPEPDTTARDPSSPHLSANVPQTVDTNSTSAASVSADDDAPERHSPTHGWDPLVDEAHSRSSSPTHDQPPLERADTLRPGDVGQVQSSVEAETLEPSVSESVPRLEDAVAESLNVPQAPADPSAKSDVRVEDASVSAEETANAIAATGAPDAVPADPIHEALGNFTASVPDPRPASESASTASTSIRSESPASSSISSAFDVVSVPASPSIATTDVTSPVGLSEKDEIEVIEAREVKEGGRIDGSDLRPLVEANTEESSGVAP